MIRIAITKEAHRAIVKTLVEGMALSDLEEVSDGRLFIWLPQGIARALASLRRPGEDYSETIIRIAKGGL